MARPGAVKGVIMSSATKQKIDEFRASLPVGDEHVEPTREMLRVASFACNGAPDKTQALADAVGEVALFLAMAHRGEAHRIDRQVDAAIQDHIAACTGKTQHTTTTTTTDKTTSDGGGVAAALAGALKKYPLVVFFGLLGVFATLVLVICLAIVYHGDTKPVLESIPGLDSPYTSARADSKGG